MRWADGIRSRLEQWGQPYHTIYFEGKEYTGDRDCLHRVNLLNLFPWSRILDLGCNVGGMIWPYRLYTEGVAVERDKPRLEWCRDMAKHYHVSQKYEFVNMDLQTDLRKLDRYGKFDTIFLLSMTQHLSNWAEVLQWCHEHCTLLIIEYNGQPPQVEEYTQFMNKLRFQDFIEEKRGRYLFVAYVPITFEFDGIMYHTYEFDKANYVRAYRCIEHDAMIKVYCDKGVYEKELHWCQKVECAPTIIYHDDDAMVMVQEFCGSTITYYNCPDDCEDQIANIKQQLIRDGCDGNDCEIFVKNGKIKLVDFGACGPYDEDKGLHLHIDRRMNQALFRKKQFFAGEPITLTDPAEVDNA